MQRQTQLVNELWPLLLPRIQGVLGGVIVGATGGGGGELTPHALGSTGWHTGALADAQAPQFLKADGSRALTGNLSVADGVTIDGVDLSALDFHGRQHNVLDPLDHVLTGAAGQVVGLTAADTLGLVGPGEGLYFNTDAWHINAGEGLEISSDAIRLKESVAGAGLTYAAGVINVGQGAGLTVSADAVALTTPVDTVERKPSGFPIAITNCPTRKASLSPSSANGRSRAASRTSARSVSGSSPTSSASSRSPSSVTAVSFVRPLATWLLVSA